jgi:hypothetical protein
MNQLDTNSIQPSLARGRDFMGKHLSKDIVPSESDNVPHDKYRG